jgi:hypothetical protein
MHDKITLGVESLNRIKFIMEYDSNKTSIENLISEQTAFTNRLDRIYADPKKAEEFHKQNAAMMDGLYDWFASFDTHDWLAFVEISTGILGLIPTPLSPLFLGISTLAGIADAGVYYSEGDYYMAAMMLALAVIPGAELSKAFKGSRVFLKRGVKGSKELIKKYKSGVKLTKEEIDDLAKLGKDFTKNSNQITKSLTEELTEKLIKGLAKKTPKYLINLLLILKKLGIIKLSEIAIKLGGTTYWADKLYLYIFRDSIFENEKNLDIRTKNELRMMINKLLGYDKEVNEFLLITAKDAMNKAMKNPKVKLVEIKPTETPQEFYKESLQKLKEEAKLKQQLKLKQELALSAAPTIEEVKSGKKVIKKGQKGESVKEIQKMLHSIGYDYLVSDFGNFEKWDDGDYGESTKLAVETFQDNFGLKTDGIVGKETLNKLTDEYNKK